MDLTTTPHVVSCQHGILTKISVCVPQYIVIRMCVCAHLCMFAYLWERERERERETRYSSSVSHRLLPLDCWVEGSGSIEPWMAVSSFDDVNRRPCVLKSFQKDLDYIVHIKVVKRYHRKLNLTTKPDWKMKYNAADKQW